MSRIPPLKASGLLIALVVLAVPGSASAHSATISGGTANADWTVGNVSNMILVMDDCGSDQASCQWAAVAAVKPTTIGCPADWQAGQSSGLRVFWTSGYQTGDVAVQSGPLDFALDGTVGQRVCLYLERAYPTGDRDSSLWLSKLLKGPAPPPAQAPALTEAVARDEANQALRKRFGKRFKQGVRKRLRCAENSPTEYDCRVRWTYEGDRYKGHVLVTLSSDGQLQAKIKVRRRR